VRADVDEARAKLRDRCARDTDTAHLLAEAHELYRVRELAEVPRYEHAV
jgi:hypothetical protein